MLKNSTWATYGLASKNRVEMYTSNTGTTKNTPEMMPFEKIC